MATLPTELFDTVHSIFVGHFETFDDRKEILAPLFGWQPVYKDIRWEGSAAAFATHLIELLSARQLIATLQRVPVGVEQQPHITDLCQRLEILSPDAPTTALSASFATYHQAVIARSVNDRRWRIDSRFVRLTLIKDQGPDVLSGRWQEQSHEYSDLRLLLADTPYPSLVLLGAPGSGKTTLLRRLQLDDAHDRLADGALRVSFLVPLNRYPLSACNPAEWLAEQWRAEATELPPFDALARQGRLLLLLDAVNELKHRDRDDLVERIVCWRDFLRNFSEHGNTTIVTCRSLDYSESLGSNDAPVQNANVKPMSPEQMQAFLVAYLPEQADRVWRQLQDDPKQQELFSTPYFLRLLCENDEVRRLGHIPNGRAALFTGLVRQALRRELDAQNPMLRDHELLTRDDRVQINADRWASPHQLPEHGLLIPKLALLAYEMQHALRGDGMQVRTDKDEALHLIGSPRADEITRVGVGLNVLDDDVARGEVLFFHQLLQEYFAARYYARQPDYSLARSEWRVDSIQPTLTDLLRNLPESDPLPPAPTTGWEETARLAAAMNRDPDAFVNELAAHNLPLAARCAAAPGVTVSAELTSRLQQQLIARTEDASADLRARIEAGLALGELGDPRLVRHTGPYGDYLLPGFVPVAGGTYTIGDDDSRDDDEKPAHPVQVEPFQMSRIPVTNAEYALFIRAGGYDDERWWDTAQAKAWRRGEGQVEGQRQSWRDSRRTLLQWEEADLRQLITQGRATTEQVDDWIIIRNWTEEEFESWLASSFPEGEIYRLPRFWDDPQYNNPNQPVVGVSWSEARAYCTWLTAQSGQEYHLPSEVEWEAATGGRATEDQPARSYAYPGEFDAARCNTFESHIRRTTPVGVFPGGETPQGIVDLSGNVWEWTSSAYLGYPYQNTPEREDPGRTDVQNRVLRGGSWHGHRDYARCAYRGRYYPFYRDGYIGFRVVVRSAPVP